MKANITVSRVKTDFSRLAGAIKALTSRDVFIGVPEDKTARSEAGGTGISNAYLAYIHEHGVPENNLPARPALIPGIRDIQADAAKLMKDAAKKAFDGDENAVPAALDKIGLLGQNAVRAKFVDNDWPALAESTLNAKALIERVTDVKGREKKVYAKSRAAQGKTNPLIDTGQMRKSYTHVIRERVRGGRIVTGGEA